MKTKFIVVLFIFIFPSLQLSALDRVVDNAGLLSATEKNGLVRLINSVSTAYNFDLVIVTENSIGHTRPVDYADDFFDNNGYGFGSRDGCLFLIVTGSRDYLFSTSGRGIDLLNSTAFTKLSSGVVKHLREDNYYAAFNAFLEDWQQFLVLKSAGRNYNFFYRWNIVLVSAGWLIAFLTGFIVVEIWKRGMNTAMLQTHASAYIVPDSLVFNEKKESFLYSSVSKSTRQSDTSSGGGIHTGSSGRSHGGGGGKY